MGIDPGVANTGFGVVRVAGSSMAAIDGGTIEVSADMPAEQRLRTIHESLTELITFSCVVGSRVVERLGAVAGLPRAQDVAGHMPADLRPR